MNISERKPCPIEMNSRCLHLILTFWPLSRCGMKGNHTDKIKPCCQLSQKVLHYSSSRAEGLKLTVPLNKTNSAFEVRPIEPHLHHLASLQVL